MTDFGSTTGVLQDHLGAEPGIKVLATAPMPSSGGWCRRCVVWRARSSAASRRARSCVVQGTLTRISKAGDRGVLPRHRDHSGGHAGERLGAPRGGGRGRGQGGLTRSLGHGARYGLASGTQETTEERRRQEVRGFARGGRVDVRSRLGQAHKRMLCLIARVRCHSLTSVTEAT